MEALGTDGTTTGTEDLTWRKQRNAINPYAKQKFPRERAESRPECQSIECKRSKSESEIEIESESESESENESWS